MDAHPTVFIVDDDVATCEQVALLLGDRGLRIEPHASIQSLLVEYIPPQRGCLLLKAAIPGLCDCDPLTHLAESIGECLLVIVAAQLDDASALTMMSAGAVDVLRKPIDGKLLKQSVDAAIERDAAMRHRQARCRDVQQRIESLTRRERQVLDLVVEGKPTKGIANVLGSSFHTVRNQRVSILKKFEADSTVDLVRMVASVGEL